MTGDVETWPRHQAPSKPSSAVSALCLATAAEGIFLGGVLPVFPAIRAAFSISSGAVFWTNAVFLLSVGITCPILSRLGDLYGHKKLIVTTLIISVTGILLDIVAPNYGVFLVGRALLGFCPAITPLSIGVFRQSLPEKYTRFGIGAIAAAMTGGSAVGMIYAGYVFNWTQSISAVFASWLILLVAAIVAVIRLVPETRLLTSSDRMDWAGAATLGGGVALLLFGLAYGPVSGWGRPAVIVPFVLALSFIVSWIAIERRSSRPLVDLRMLMNPAARPFYVSSFLWGAAVYGSQTTIVLFMVASERALGYGFTLSILPLAWLVLPQGIMNMLGSLFVKRVVSHFGGYRVSGMIGAALMATGFVGLASANTVLWQFLLFACIGGFGQGFMQPTLSGRVSELCAPTQRGISAGMFQTFKNIGGSVASACGAAVFAASSVGSLHGPGKIAYIIIFSGCLFVSVCMVIVIGLSRSEQTVRLDSPRAVPVRR